MPYSIKQREMSLWSRNRDYDVIIIQVSVNEKYASYYLILLTQPAKPQASRLDESERLENGGKMSP